MPCMLCSHIPESTFSPKLAEPAASPQVIHGSLSLFFLNKAGIPVKQHTTTSSKNITIPVIAELGFSFFSSYNHTRTLNILC